MGGKKVGESADNIKCASLCKTMEGEEGEQNFSSEEKKKKRGDAPEPQRAPAQPVGAVARGEARDAVAQRVQVAAQYLPHPRRRLLPVPRGRSRQQRAGLLRPQPQKQKQLRELRDAPQHAAKDLQREERQEVSWRGGGQEAVAA